MNDQKRFEIGMRIAELKTQLANAIGEAWDYKELGQNTLARASLREASKLRKQIRILRGI